MFFGWIIQTKIVQSKTRNNLYYIIYIINIFIIPVFSNILNKINFVKIKI